MKVVKTRLEAAKEDLAKLLVQEQGKPLAGVRVYATSVSAAKRTKMYTATILSPCVERGVFLKRARARVLALSLCVFVPVVPLVPTNPFAGRGRD